MSTQSEFRTETPQTPIAQLPPLDVVTEGIPASEHVEPLPTVAPVSTERRAQTRTRRIILALEAVLVLIIVGAFSYGVTQILAESTAAPHMGLSEQAWSEYRAGERAPAPLIPITRAWTPWVAVTPFTQP
jgi:hypothetical protein